MKDRMTRALLIVTCAICGCGAQSVPEPGSPLPATQPDTVKQQQPAKEEPATIMQNDVLQLRLPPHWSQTQNSAPAQFSFSSTTAHSQMTASYEPVNVPASRLKEVIEKFVEFRMQAEADAVFPRKLKLRGIEFKEDGKGGQQVVYSGSTEDGTYHYSFFGVALESKVVSLFCETNGSSPEQNQIAFEEALEGLTY
jgi:hypothetical protein